MYISWRWRPRKLYKQCGPCCLEDLDFPLTIPALQQEFYWHPPFSLGSDRVQWLQQRSYRSQNLRLFLSGSLQEKLTNPSVCVLSHSVMPDSCDPIDCNLPGSSVHGILQARMLEWVAISFSRGSSQPRNRTQVSYTAGRFFTDWATREAP